MGTGGSGSASGGKGTKKYTYTKKETVSPVTMESARNVNLNNVTYNAPSGKAPTYKKTKYTSDYNPTEYTNNYKPTEYTDSYTPQQYQSKYMPQIEEKLNSLTNWSYDPLQDASYQALAAVYGARGNQAAKNSLADAAMLNGGYGTSNAVTAAQQARNQYNQELAANIPQLEQAAYNRAQTGLNALMDIDNSQYGRFADYQNQVLAGKQFGLDVFNTNEGNRQWAESHNLDVFNANEGNRQFAAQLGLDYDKLNQAEKQYLFETRYNNYRDKVGDAQWEANFNYDKAKSMLDQYRWAKETNMGIQQYLDAQAEKEKAKSGGGGGGRRSGGGGGSYYGGGSDDNNNKGPITVDEKTGGKVYGGSVEGINRDTLKQQQSLRKKNSGRKNSGGATR